MTHSIAKPDGKIHGTQSTLANNPCHRLLLLPLPFRDEEASKNFNQPDGNGPAEGRDCSLGKGASETPSLGQK
jgi:hypothetical protein